MQLNVSDKRVIPQTVSNRAFCQIAHEPPSSTWRFAVLEGVALWRVRITALPAASSVRRKKVVLTSSTYAQYASSAASRVTRAPLRF